MHFRYPTCMETMPGLSMKVFPAADNAVAVEL